MATAVLRYKCRCCDTITDGSNIPEPGARRNMQVVLFHTQKGNPNERYPIYDIHECPDGGYGISDLIGADIRDS